MSVEHTFQSFLGKKVLIIGDVGTGKTRLTVRLLEEAIRLGLSNKITVIDMAPASIEVRGSKIGGRLLEASDKLNNLRYLAPDIVETPRLSARSASELHYLVSLNEKRIRPIIIKYIEKPTPILFVNDISLYLQSGVDENVLSAMKTAETFIANGYYGEMLRSEFEKEVSKVEKKLMGKLANSVDIVVRL